MDQTPRIELPHALECYFAHAELAPNRNGRCFTITFPYFDGDRLDRLQWWWQVGTAQERIGGQAGLDALRREAIDRFRQHIARWLVSSRKRLFDGDPFPRLAALGEADAGGTVDAGQDGPDQTGDVPLGRVSNA